jgi:hypothetical protein
MADTTIPADVPVVVPAVGAKNFTRLRVEHISIEPNGVDYIMDVGLRYYDPATGEVMESTYGMPNPVSGKHRRFNVTAADMDTFMTFLKQLLSR